MLSRWATLAFVVAIACLAAVLVLVNPNLASWAAFGVLAAVVVLTVRVALSRDGGRVVLVVVVAIASVGAVLYLASGRVDYSVAPPARSRTATFTTEARFVGPGARELHVQTTVELDPTVIDEILKDVNAGGAASGPFKDLDGAERDAAIVLVSGAMAAEDFAPDRDRGALLTYVRSEPTEALPELGLPPGRRLYADVVIRVPEVRIPLAEPDSSGVSALVIEPNEKSTVIIEAPADAVVNVSPAGKTERLGDVERRTVSLDRPGSIEATEVTGDLAHPWLAFEGLNWLIGLSQRRVIGFVIGLVAAAIVALMKDKLKELLKRILSPKKPDETEDGAKE